MQQIAIVTEENDRNVEIANITNTEKEAYLFQ